MKPVWIVSVLLLLPAGLPAQRPALPDAPPDTLATACAAPEFRQFDFWLGRWSVAVPGEEPRAVNQITRRSQGCALEERYHNASGYTGMSVNWYDRADGVWRQLWVDNAGLVLELEGELDAGGRMVLAGDRRLPDGTTIRDRITWAAQADGSVHQIWDVSEDGGDSWQNTFTGIYRPAPP